MSRIRCVKNSDYEYINKAIINYGTFFREYATVITNLLIRFNGLLSSTLVVETNNGDITGFDINLLKPYSFWNEVYKNLSFFKKIKWVHNNYQNSISNKSNDNLQNIYNNLYKTDDKTAYTLFYTFNKIPHEPVRASDIGILQLKLIADIYTYQTAEIKADNTASIKSYNKRGFNTAQYCEYEKGILFSIIDISKIKELVKNYQINNLIELDDNYYEIIRGGVSRSLIYLKEKLFICFTHIFLNKYRQLLLGGCYGYN